MGVGSHRVALVGSKQRNFRSESMACCYDPGGFRDAGRHSRIYYRRERKWLQRPFVRGDRRSSGPTDRADLRSSRMEISFSEPYTFSCVRYREAAAIATA